MSLLQDIALKLGRMFSVIGISNPDEVRRKSLVYQQQRAARLARQAKEAAAASPPTPPSTPRNS